MSLFISGVECMTVKELIERLQQFPEGAPIVYPYRSDYAPLSADDVRLERAEDRTLVYRTGGVRDTYPAKQWGDEKPEFVTAVVFPGN